MKKQFIIDLKPGDKVQNFFVAERKYLEDFRDKTKGRFLTLVLADRSGRILGRAWENGPALYDQFEEGDVILVAGQAEMYLDRLQVIVRRLRAARPEDKDKYFSDDDFVPQTDKDIAALWSSVVAAVETISNPYLTSLLQDIIADEDMVDRLQTAPASKAMHHPYRGGLLEHIVEMLAVVQPLFDLYPRLDHDLLVSGIILHDLGMIEGARYERSIDYSDAGRLLGYAVLGDRLVAARIAAIADFPPDLALALSHMILTHQGEAQYGAVREPQTLEATALFLLHKLSAELHHVQEVLDKQVDGEKPWTDFDTMVRRSYFRGRSAEPAAAPEAPPPHSNGEESPADGMDTIIAERGAAWGDKPSTPPAAKS